MTRPLTVEQEAALKADLARIPPVFRTVQEVHHAMGCVKKWEGVLTETDVGMLLQRLATSLEKVLAAPRPDVTVALFADRPLAVLGGRSVMVDFFGRLHVNGENGQSVAVFDAGRWKWAAPVGPAVGWVREGDGAEAHAVEARILPAETPGAEAVT